MSKSLRRAASAFAAPLVSLVLVFLPFSSIRALAQSTTRETPFERQLGRIDFAISAAGMFSDTVTGTEQRDNTPLTLHPSSTVGELATLRYTAKPYFGLEFNFSNVRLTQNFTSQQSYIPTVQNGVRELDFGYIVHPTWRPLGIQPFAGAGAGTTRFTPTTFGGEGLPEQYRATYFWTIGAEDNFPNSHFGMRVAFRQLYYLGPDFLQNYLTMLKRVRTTDPTIGFFVRF